MEAITTSPEATDSPKINTQSPSSKTNGYGSSNEELDQLPVITNGFHSDHTSDMEIQAKKESISLEKEIVSATIANGNAHHAAAKLEVTQIQVEPLRTIKVNRNEFLEGPDQVIPSNDLFTIKADGSVKIQREGGFLTNLQPLSVPGLLHKTATRYPDSVAIASKDQEGKWQKTTFKEYEILVRTCAKAFIKLGLKRYHSVAILGFNSPEWFISDMAAIYAGGFAAGIYTTNSAESCFHCAESSAANVIVVQDEKQLEKILSIRDKLPELKAIVQYEGKPTEEGVLSWEEMMKIGYDQSDTELDTILKSISANECCTLVYTSGTVGKPKAVMLSHDNLTWTGRVVSEYLRVVKGEEVVVSYLPLSHVAAQIVDIYLSLTAAAAVYFGDKNALKGSLVQTLQEARPTQFLGVPRVWEKINEKMVLTGSQGSGLRKAIASWAKGVGLQHNMDRMNGVQSNSFQYMLANAVIYKRIRKALGLDRCKLMLSGAAPLATEIKKYFWSLDMTLLEGFGMSETAGCHTLNTNNAFRLESIGRTVPGCFTKISDPDSNKQGEILLKGRNIFMGYLNDLPKTAETFDEEGWFRSGDVGTIDSEGFVYITGRIKELIITAGGENVAPVLIEHNIMEELKCISKAIVIGDQRKFLCVLLTLKSEINIETGEPLDELNLVSKNWCQEIGSTAKSISEIIDNKDEKVYTAIQAGIDRANVKAISNAQKVQKFAIVSKDFSLGSGELGPTMKVKRNVVSEKHADIIESFYT